MPAASGNHSKHTYGCEFVQMQPRFAGMGRQRQTSCRETHICDNKHVLVIGVGMADHQPHDLDRNRWVPGHSTFHTCLGVLQLRFPIHESISIRQLCVEAVLSAWILAGLRHSLCHALTIFIAAEAATIVVVKYFGLHTRVSTA